MLFGLAKGNGENLCERINVNCVGVKYTGTLKILDIELKVVQKSSMFLHRGT